jgi:hypothetical protein
MTEAEWLDGTDPDELLRSVKGRASDRKLRLFAVECCCRIRDHIADESSRQAIRVSERYADGRATFEELEAAFLAADRVFSNPSRWGGMRAYHAVDAARLAAHPEMRGLADGTATAAAMAAPVSGGDFWEQYASEKAQQCILLRDIIGNPFRPVTVEPSWRTPAVVALVTAIYEERRFAESPVLADALEEVNCTNRDILRHLREPGQVHVRGCWCLDLLLEKH